MTRVIVDPGSTHDGDSHKAFRLVEIAANAGADAIKFQLLSDRENKGGNIGMDWEWLPDLIAAGRAKRIEVFASVFDRSGWDYLIKLGCKSVKLSYSQANTLPLYPHSSPLERVYVSQDIMSPRLELTPVQAKGRPPRAMELIRLYCLPLYPVQYVVDFEGLFPRFHGFSSHCLGTAQEIKAAEMGAEVLEFHMQGDWVSNTPDGRFAKTPVMVEKICKAVKR